MRSVLLLLALAVGTHAQQLPAGTRDANDHSQENAASARMNQAEAALEKGDFPSAVKLLKALAAEHPKDAQVLYDLGYAEERSGDETGAEQAYEGAIAAAPNVAEPRLALGLLDARAGRTAKARSELISVAEMESAAPQNRGRAYRALAQLDEHSDPATASTELLAAIKLTGETPEDAALTAALAERSGDASAAETSYRRALQQHPEDMEAATGLAHILERSNRSAEAETVLAAPLKAHPDDPRVVSEMASVYASEGKTKDATALLATLRALPAFAHDATLARQLARLYAVDNQNAEAEKLFRQLLTDDTKAAQDPTILDDLGSVLVRQQKYAEAEQVLGQAVAQRDRFPSPAAFGDAAGHLAFAASKNGHPQAVLQALSVRATVLPNSGPSLFLEATAHDTLHQYREAERSYRAFLAIANGQFPDQEFQAKHRLVALEHMK